MSALSSQTQAQLRAVSISTLSTVLFKRGFRNRVMQGVGPLSPSAVRMVGPAFTLRFIPAREDLDTMEDYALPTHVQRRAIEECPAEHVLVIDARGLLRSMNRLPVSQYSCPANGSQRSDCLPTITVPGRSAWATTNASWLLWWLAT